jgi:hypothetical protein
MTPMGHKDQLRPPSLSGCCRLVEATFARMGGNEEDAPITAIYATRMELAGSTHSKSSRLADLRYKLDDYLRPGASTASAAPYRRRRHIEVGKTGPGGAFCRLLCLL